MPTYTLMIPTLVPEPFNRDSWVLTILGFLGIAPEVGVIVDPLPGPVRLCFIVITAPGRGQHRSILEVRDPENIPLVVSPEIPIEIPDNGEINRLMFTVGLAMTAPGLHRFLLRLGPRVHYETTFRVSGPPARTQGT